MADGSLFGRVQGPICIDLFAGGGGASEGVRRALGYGPVVAINHCKHAIEMHRANHPEAEHYLEDVFDVAPMAAARGRHIDLLWASPSCTHFSRAKGGKPVDKGIRGLSWIVRDWARDVRPRVIMVENVIEWTAWGPLDERGKPIKDRMGETFREFVSELRGLGYVVEWRALIAADYGAPTSRKRLYLIARCDGEAIVWPVPTHGKGRAKPWRTAAECIDWSIPMLSIFATPKEAGEWAKATKADGVPKRPLAEPTQRRIAEGIRRFVLNHPRPFIVGIDNRERKGQSPRVHDPALPWGTVTAKGSQGALVAAFLDKHYTSARAGQALDEPVPTVTGGGGHVSVVAAFVAQHNGGENGHQAFGRDLREPMQTIAGNVNKALVSAFMCKYYGEGGQWCGLDEPMHTLTAKARMGLVTVDIDGETYAIVDIAMRMLQPHELAAANGWRRMRLHGSKSDQVARIGNMVVPDVAEALVRANVGGDYAMAAK